MRQPSDFESAVFAWIASRYDDPALRAQLRDPQIVRRNHTGSGCYSDIVVAEGTAATTGSYGERGPLAGPYFESAAVENGGGTLLWFKDGFADSLEIYSHGGSFPADHRELTPFKLTGA